MMPVFSLGAVAGLSALEHLINKTLRLDPVTLDRLQLLENRTLLLHLTQPEVVLGATWVDGCIVLKGLPEQVDASLMATLPAALGLLTHKEKIAALQSGDITISGDTALLQQTLAVLQEAELDWESVLTDKLGTVAGHALGQGIRTFFSWAKDTNQRFSRNAAEYVTEEARLVVSAAEVEMFCEDVTSLQLDMDRLAARVEQLESASDTNNHGS